jgi:DNA-damage-inducible protein J
VVLQRGIPFDMKLPQHQVLDMSSLSKQQFNSEIEKGMDDLHSGRVSSTQSVAERMRQEYGV